MSNNTTFDDSETISLSKTTEDKLYLYLTLITQIVGSLALITVAVLRFIATKQNSKLNTIKNIYYTNKNKIISSEDTENQRFSDQRDEPRDEEAKLEKCK